MRAPERLSLLGAHGHHRRRVPPAHKRLMTLRDLARTGEQNLTAAGVPDAKHDAMVLLLDSFGIAKKDYVLHGETDLIGTAPGTEPSFVKEVAEALEKYRDGIRRRSERVPLQQILGTAPFYGLDFFVNEHVLVPRGDTEVLVEAVIEDLDGSGKGITCLDLCTGSGCIGITLAKHTGMQVTLSDISEEALAVARRNARKYAPDCEIVQSDLFEAIPGRRFGIITCNPPYIADDVIPTLMPEVKDHEPYIALSGGTDGLDFYRRLAGEAQFHLFPHGRIYLEIGFDQGGDVSRLLTENGFTNVKVHKDYCGNDRVVSALKIQHN